MLKKKIDIDTMKVINHIKNSIIDNNDNVYGKNVLISIYLQCKDITNAIKVFDSIPENKKSLISITVMMKAYNHNEEYSKTILLYEQYNGKHDDISNTLFIKACSNIGDYNKGKEVINSIIKDINSHSIQFITTLIDFYCKSGHIDNALNIFNNIPENKKDIVSIGAMMNAHNNNEEYSKAILLYEQYNGKHDDISNTLFIKACTNIGDYDKGKEVINSINKDVARHSIEFITTLIDFYGKSGDVDNAFNIFSNILPLLVHDIHI